MNDQKQSNQLLSYREVCKLTQLSQATIRRYVKKRFLSYASHTITRCSKCEISPRRRAEVAFESLMGAWYVSKRR